MAKRFSLEWLYNTDTAPEFAARLKKAIAKYSTYLRNVWVKSSPLAYHGYLEYPGGSLDQGHENAETIADVVSTYFRPDRKTPEKFRLYMDGEFMLPPGVGRGGRGISGKVLRTETIAGQKRIVYTARQSIGRGTAQWAAGVIAWLDKHRDHDSSLLKFRVNFVSLALKNAAPKTAPKAPGSRNGSGRGNGRVQRANPVRVRSGDRRKSNSRAESKGVRKRSKKKRAPKRR